MAKVTKSTQKAPETVQKPPKPVLSDLAYIQSNLSVPKDQHNDHKNFNFRSAESILAAAKPFLKERNCYVILNDECYLVGERYYIRAIAYLKKDGETIEEASALAREPQSKNGMDDAQVTGSSSSYARKYALSGLFAINEEKDPDHNPAKKVDPVPTSAKSTPPPIPKNTSKPVTTKNDETTKYKPTANQESLMTNMLQKPWFTDEELEKLRYEYKLLKTGKEVSGWIGKVKIAYDIAKIEARKKNAEKR